MYPRFDAEEWSTDYRGKCGNCHEILRDGDRYCRYCGTARGEGKFEPYQNIIQCIYGPMPVDRIRKCAKCNKTWKTCLMIDNEWYCPDCGAPSKIIEEDGKKPLHPSLPNTQKKRRWSIRNLFK